MANFPAVVKVLGNELVLGEFHSRTGYLHYHLKESDKEKLKWLSFSLGGFPNDDGTLNFGTKGGSAIIQLLSVFEEPYISLKGNTIGELVKELEDTLLSLFLRLCKASDVLKGLALSEVDSIEGETLLGMELSKVTKNYYGYEEYSVKKSTRSLEIEPLEIVMKRKLNDDGEGSNYLAYVYMFDHFFGVLTSYTFYGMVNMLRAKLMTLSSDCSEIGRKLITD